MSAVIAERPEWARKLVLMDIVREQRRFGYERFKSLNRRAVLAGINLAVSLETAGERTREWLIEDLRRDGR